MCNEILHEISRENRVVFVIGESEEADREDFEFLQDGHAERLREHLQNNKEHSRVIFNRTYCDISNELQ